MRTFTEEELHQVIAKHKDWLDGVEGGERANLSSANLSSADLSYADLSFANLSSANLSSANLSSADLSCAVGNIENIKSMQCDMWMVSYTDTMLNIGCQTHRITEWWRFSDDEISRMDSSALKWWAVWKPILQQIITASPAMPTGYMEKSE